MTTPSGLAAVHAAVHALDPKTGTDAPAPAAVAAQQPAAATAVPPAAIASGTVTALAAAAAAPVDAAAIALSVKTRISSIQKLESAKGREALASHIAMETDLSVEQADAMLKATPIATAVAGGSLSEAMKHVANPSLGTGAGVGKTGQDAPKPVQIDHRGIYDRYNGVKK